jgi:hypothetical protein
VSCSNKRAVLELGLNLDRWYQKRPLETASASLIDWWSLFIVRTMCFSGRNCRVVASQEGLRDSRSQPKTGRPVSLAATFVDPPLKARRRLPRIRRRWKFDGS